MRRIKFTLDTVDAAIRELKEYKKEFERKAAALLQRLVEEGVRIAVEEAPSDFGDLKASISGSVEGGKGVIRVGEPYAVYVELGFGARGARSPHPEISVQYDVNSHGEQGWVYYDKKRKEYRRSRGEPANPFLYRTARRLESRAAEIAKEVFEG